MKETHVIVATGTWDQDHLRYRRHRLAEYLHSLDNTDEVIWVCPVPKRQAGPFNKLINGITEYQIDDLHSARIFRFGRYYDIFYKNKLVELKNYLSRKKTKKYLWFTFPGFPYLSKLEDWDRVVYDCSDLWAAPIGGNQGVIMKWREKSIRQSENRIISESDRIFCTSDFLGEKVKENLIDDSKEVIVLENGVEYDRFIKSSVIQDERLLNLRKPVLGYIGGIKPKLDFRLLSKISDQYPDWSIVFIGPDGTNGDQDFKNLLNKKNVQWLGKVDPGSVPEYMKGIDIGLLPYKQSIYNKAVFPLKMFEFLACGKPVIGMNLPSTKKYEEPNVYHYAEKDDEFIKEIEDLMMEVNNPIYIEKRIKIARQRDWNEIFDTMYSYVME